MESQDHHSNYYVLPPNNGSDPRYPFSLKSPPNQPGFNQTFPFPPFTTRSPYIKSELHSNFPNGTNFTAPSSFANINGAILKTDHNLIGNNPINPMDLAFWTSQPTNWTPELYNNPNLIEEPSFTPVKNLKYQVVLEAPTANNINVGDQPITYLNKSQYYNITLQDQHQFDGIIKTSIILQFYKPEDRKETSKNWERWFKLQSSSKSANTITIDSTSSKGIIAMGPSSFDRATITWNGSQGARLALKFNCLSTDFIEVKGVSGKPLRVTIQSTIETNHSEFSFAQIKIYRDKGAERKNMEGNPLKKFKSANREDSNLYAPSYPNTIFYPVHWDSYDEIPLAITNHPESDPLIRPSAIRDKKFNTLSGAEFPDLVGIDSSYIPHLRPIRSLRCLFIKTVSDSFYLPIHLQRLTLVELIEKVANQFHLQAGTISSCTRRNLDGVLSHFDDQSVSQLLDEMDMILDITYLPKSMALTFQY